MQHTYYTTWYTFVCLGFMVNGARSVKLMPDVIHIGLGYDIVRGNPHSDRLDPGLQKAVFELKYPSSWNVSNSDWLLPINTNVVKQTTCNSMVNAHEVTSSMVGYVNSLHGDIVAYHDQYPVNFAFTASSQYEDVRIGVHNYHKSYVESVAKYVHHRLRITNIAQMKVTQEFRNAVINLPNLKNDEEYFKFFRKFGTHYANEITFGAKFVVRSEFEKSEWTTMKSRSFNFRQAAQDSLNNHYFPFSSMNLQCGNRYKLRKEFDSKRSSYELLSVGRLPTTRNELDEWSQTMSNLPRPIAYALQPLPSLFTTAYISGITSEDLQMKVAFWRDAISIYRGTAAHSDNDIPSPSVNMWHRNESVFVGEIFANCKRRFSLLSCGTPYSTPLAKNQFAYPLNITSCHCRSSIESRCIVWCSLFVDSLEVVNQRISSNHAVAKCSQGKKVVACHLRHQHWNYPVDYYSSDDGTSCVCKDPSDSTNLCLATCASQIKNHSIRKKIGIGKIKVTCVGSSTILGCGFQSYQTASDHNTFVTTDNSCECSSFDKINNFICYAICGTLD